MMSQRDLKQFFKKSQIDLVFTQATALAYTTLLSIVPILAVAFFFFKAFGGFEQLYDKMLPFIEENLAPSFSQQISQYLSTIVANAHAGTMGILGVVGFIFTSISTLATIERTFNMIWGITKPRAIGRRITTYWSMLTIGPIFLGLSIFFSSKAIMWLKADTGEISKVLMWSAALLPYFSSGLLFAGLYFFMPNARVSKRDAFISGCLTGFIFEGAKSIYALYAVRALANNPLYGSLAIVPVFMIWLYVVWVIILLGAEFCCYLQFKRLHIPYKFSNEDRLNPFLIADILDLLGREQKNPKGGMSEAQLLSHLKIPLKELTAHLDFLEDEGWIISSSGKFMQGKKFHLAVSMAHVRMPQILSQLEDHRYLPKSEKGLEVHKKLKALWADWELT